MGNGASFLGALLDELLYQALANVVQGVDTLTSLAEAFVASTAPPTAPGGSRPPNSYYWGTRLASPGHAPSHAPSHAPLRVDINGNNLGYLQVDPSLHSSVRELLKGLDSAQHGTQALAHATVVCGARQV